MKIAHNTVVTVHYQLFDTQSNVIEEATEPMVYLHGGYGTVPSKIEAALEGKKIQDKVTVQLEPQDAFGDYDVGLLRVEPRNRFPTELTVGMQFEGIPDEAASSDDGLIFTVTDIAEDKVILDANHPLAGMALRFKLQVLAIRPATPIEIAHKHVHTHEEDCDDDPDSTSLGEFYRSHFIH